MPFKNVDSPSGISGFIKQMKSKFFTTKSIRVSASIYGAQDDSSGSHCKINVVRTGKDGSKDSSRLWAILDYGADANCMYKQTAEELFGIDGFYHHDEPLDVRGIEGTTNLKSIGWVLLVLSFEGQQKRHNCLFEVLSGHGPQPGNFDVILGRPFLKATHNIEINKNITTYHVKIPGLNNRPIV